MSPIVLGHSLTSDKQLYCRLLVRFMAVGCNRLNAELNILGKEKTKEPQQLKLTLRGPIEGHKINK